MNNSRALVLELVQRHGWNATAFQTLETGYQYFFSGDDACVAYVDTGAAWVAAGAPIAAPDAIARVADEFLRAAAGAKRRCCFAATEERLQLAAGSALRSIRIGEQPVWDPRDWKAIVDGHRSLREQLRRARAKGIATRMLSEDELHDSGMRSQLARLVEQWLATRHMAPMGFLVHVEPFTFPAFRRCFVAELGGEIVAFAGVIPVPARRGWFIEDMVRAPDAPNGTAEVLTDAVMRWAAAEDCDWLTLGLAPLAGDVTGLLRVARSSSSLFYDFDGLRRYKAKLRPHKWSPIYVSHPPQQSATRTMIDVLVAFSREGLLRFGIRTWMRGPSSVLRLLALLLIAWIGLMATAPADVWFGSPWEKWAWIAFDMLVAVGLFRLARSQGRALASMLAVAVSCDAAITLWRALTWNLRHSRGAAYEIVVALACIAPIMAAAALWGRRKGIR